MSEIGSARALTLDLARVTGSDYFMPDSMAGGCALVDVDSDGDLDVFVTHGRWENGHPAKDGLGRLWIQGEDGQFSDQSLSAGVIGPHYAMGVATGDANNDGHVDLYVTCFGPDQLLINRGDRTFDLRADAVACDRTAQWGASATFVDLDADGWLDLAVSNYVDYPENGGGAGKGENADYPAPGNYEGTLDALLFNRGDGTFEDRSARLGIDEPGRGLGIATGDWNGDGRVDVYVANDGQANHCWTQGEDGHFTNNALPLGLALSGAGSAQAGMGVARGDVDEDGYEDLLLTHLVQETHTLYLAKHTKGATSFVDATFRAGIAAPSINKTGFGAALADLDLDGHLDFLAVHGRVLKGPIDPEAKEIAHWAPYAEHDLAMLGTGGRFRTVPAGDFDARPETSRGLSLGDVDGDGDLDALVTTAAGVVRLFESEGKPRGTWIAIRALERGRDALGAEVTIRYGDSSQTRSLQTSHGYLSSSEPIARFGLGSDPTTERVAEIQIRWADGKTERFDGGPVDQTLVLARK